MWNYNTDCPENLSYRWLPVAMENLADISEPQVQPNEHFAHKTEQEVQKYLLSFSPSRWLVATDKKNISKMALPQEP